MTSDSPRFPRSRLVLLVAIACAAVATAVVLLVGRSASADQLKRGAPVHLDSGMAQLDRPAIAKRLTAVRRSAHLPVLASSSCLDGVARRAAAEFARGRVPSGARGACGATSWGWVAGADRTGAQMASAIVTRPAGRGRSAFADRQWRHVGVAVGRRVVDGVASGYVLVWVVGR